MEIEYEIMQDQDNPEAWVVQGINFKGDGEMYTAIFEGADAEKRARSYFQWVTVGDRQQQAA
jgi:hypothetical protein